VTALQMYQVDAFTDRLFAGNPAAVCPLDSWLPDELMQAIALENNLSETAFFVPDGGDADYHLRWFTPACEVDLCGHATLATAHVLFGHLGFDGSEIRFRTQSGILTVVRRDGMLEMSLPNRKPEPVNAPADILSALGRSPVDYLQDRPGQGMSLAVLDDASFVRTWEPEIAAIAALPGDGLIISAPGDAAGVDCVSRYFAPHAGIDEDPVTGSAHCVLAPYWCERLGRAKIVAHQVSPRGGELICSLRGDRVAVAGRARTYLVGEISIQ